MLRIKQSHLYRLLDEALQSYPSECCGFLLGTKEGNVRRLLRCENEALNKLTNFLISANEYRQAEKKADEEGLCLLGVYHSHPDCAAKPSKYDCLAAFPNFSYLILSVSEKGATGPQCWKLNEQSCFEEEIIVIQKTYIKKNLTYGNYHYSYAPA